MDPFYFFEEGLLILSGLLGSIPTMLLSAATYVLTALAIYVMARRRGLRKPWLAWVPVVNVWLLGSLSDQYRYVVKRQNTSRRKWLLVLNLVKPAAAFGVVWFVMEAMWHISYGAYVLDLWDLWLGVGGFGLLLGAVTLASAVIRYMALYDVFKSQEPDNAVLFLVLSVLFHVTEPFFLFFNRNKDAGMPPRRQETVYAQDPIYEEPQKEARESESDYL